VALVTFVRLVRAAILNHVSWSPVRDFKPGFPNYNQECYLLVRDFYGRVRSIHRGIRKLHTKYSPGNLKGEGI
jgi:hypothetical protein